MRSVLSHELDIGRLTEILKPKKHKAQTRHLELIQTITA
jgi:hypothetical protein